MFVAVTVLQCCYFCKSFTQYANTCIQKSWNVQLLTPKNSFAKWKVCVVKNSNLKYGFKNLTRKVHMFNYCTKTKKQGQSKVQNDLSMKS